MKRFEVTWRDSMISFVILTVGSLICLWLHEFPTFHRLVDLVLVLSVFLVSVVTQGYVYGIAASLLAVLVDNFVSVFPFLMIDFLTVDSLVSAVVMLVVAIVTSKLTTNIKIQQKLKAEAEKEKMRANLLRAVSHDLRTPLTTIYGVCGLLRENYDDLPKAQQLKLLGQVQEDAKNLVVMVNNLLSVTKVNTDGVQLQMRETVLEELIDSTLVRFRKHYPNQIVQTSIPEEFVSIPMDAMLIQQVLLNLLENAVTHGGELKELVLSVTIQGNCAVFRVLDDGCGIPENRLENLFSGVVVSDDLPADSRRTGMGIGLSVCASIIHAHGGKIWGENRETGGAQISFCLNLEDETNEQ